MVIVYSAGRRMCDTQDQTEKITRAWWHGAVRAGRLEGGVGAMKTRLCQALLTASVRPVIGRGRRAPLPRHGLCRRVPLARCGPRPSVIEPAGGRAQPDDRLARFRARERRVLADRSLWHCLPTASSVHQPRRPDIMSPSLLHVVQRFVSSPRRLRHEPRHWQRRQSA